MTAKINLRDVRRRSPLTSGQDVKDELALVETFLFPKPVWLRALTIGINRRRGRGLGGGEGGKEGTLRRYLPSHYVKRRLSHERIQRAQVIFVAMRHRELAGDRKRESRGAIGAISEDIKGRRARNDPDFPRSKLIDTAGLEDEPIKLARQRPLATIINKY